MPMPENEAHKRRMEEAAENLLERVLYRRRWSAIDRERVAAFLERLVRTEEDFRRGVMRRNGR